MKTKTELLFLGTAAALTAALAAVWLRGLPAWNAPTPVVPTADAVSAAEANVPANLAGTLPQTASRPLLSADRRPHPQEMTKQAAAPEPDPFEKIVLNGVFGSGDKEGGIIVKTDDKTKRLKIGEMLGPWRLVRVQANAAHFEGGNKEARVLVLKYLASPQDKPVPVPGQTPGAVDPNAPVPDLKPAVPLQQPTRPRRRSRGT